MLRPKYEKFCREYVKAEVQGLRGPGAYAARAVGQTGSYPTAASEYGSRLMSTNTKVKERIDELKNVVLACSEITDDQLRSMAMEIALTADHARDKLSAIKLMMDERGLLVKRSEDITHKDANLLDSLSELFGPEIATEAARRMGYEVAGKDETLQ